MKKLKDQKIVILIDGKESGVFFSFVFTKNFKSGILPDGRPVKKGKEQGVWYYEAQ